MDDLISQKERERIKQFTLHHLAETGNESDVLVADAVKAICERHQVIGLLKGPGLALSSITLVESLTHCVDTLPNEFQHEIGWRSS